MSLKARIAANETLFGTFLKTPSPILVEVLAGAGLDLLCIDAEHAPFDRRDLDLCVMAGRAAELPILVRTRSAAPEEILNALDCGADGVLVPHIRSAQDATGIVAAAHYGPGGRGYAGSSRAARYGLSMMAEHRRASGERTVVVAQIEDAEALDALDAILAVDGLDALFVGRADLTVSLDAASPDDAPVVAAVDRIVAASCARRRAVGMFVPRDADVAGWHDKGARLFLQGSDHAWLRAGARASRFACGI